jgi:hypothetical protein
MHKIAKIVRVEEREKFGQPYYRTYAVLDNGDECVGFSSQQSYFKSGDSVESFFDDRWNTAKMYKPGDNPSHSAHVTIDKT